jgi:Caspase domain
MGDVTAAEDGRRRFFIATGVTRDLPRSRDRLIASVDRMVHVFTQTFGYQRVTSLRIDPTAEEIRSQLHDFCQLCNSEDIVVYYHTGHAETGKNGHRLRTGGEGNLYVTSLPTSELAELMLEATPLRNVLIILDTCFAGQGGAETLMSGMQVVGRVAGKTLAVVTAAHPTEEVRAGDFAELFERAVDHPSTGGHEPAYLPLSAIIGRIREDPRRQQWQTVSESVLFNTAAIQPFMPNPRFDTRFHGLDLLTQLRIEQQQLRMEDLRAHFLPVARGTDIPSDAGWRFMGRHAALRDLVSWIHGSGEPRIRVVTGDPGSGKSAVIGRLVVLSDPQRRSSVPLENVSTDTVPDVGTIDVAVHARGLTTDQVLAALSAPVGIQASTAGQFLTAMRTKQLFAAVDAIDEAVDPQDLVARLLRPLADASALTDGLRMLIGTRRHLLGALGPNVMALDLDGEAYADSVSVRNYAARCLRESVIESPYLVAESGLVSAVAAAVAEAAGRSFLVALIAARTLASQDRIPDPENPIWRASLPSTAADAHRSMRMRLDHYLAGRASTSPYLG